MQSSQNRIIKETQDQLDNLLNLATKGFISADEYKDKSEPLKNALAKLQMEQNNTNEKTKTWYEIIGTTLEALSSVTDRFNKGGIADKRRALSALGSNPPREFEPLIPLTRNLKNDPTGHFLHSWLGMRDSNPRMVGPEPTALPLGESPLLFIRYTLYYSTIICKNKALN